MICLISTADMLSYSYLFPFVFLLLSSRFIPFSVVFGSIHAILRIDPQLMSVPKTFRFETLANLGISCLQLVLCSYTIL